MQLWHHPPRTATVLNSTHQAMKTSAHKHIAGPFCPERSVCRVTCKPDQLVARNACWNAKTKDTFFKPCICLRFKKAGCNHYLPTGRCCMQSPNLEDQIKTGWKRQAEKERERMKTCTNSRLFISMCALLKDGAPDFLGLASAPGIPLAHEHKARQTKQTPFIALESFLVRYIVYIIQNIYDM